MKAWYWFQVAFLEQKAWRNYTRLSRTASELVCSSSAEQTEVFVLWRFCSGSRRRDRSPPSCRTWWLFCKLCSLWGPIRCSPRSRRVLCSRSWMCNSNRSLCCSSYQRQECKPVRHTETRRENKVVFSVNRIWSYLWKNTLIELTHAMSMLHLTFISGNGLGQNILPGYNSNNCLL